MYPNRPIPLNLLGLAMGLIAFTAFALDFAARDRIEWLDYPVTLACVAGGLALLLFITWRLDIVRTAARRLRRRVK